MAQEFLPVASEDNYGAVKKSEIVSAYKFHIKAPHDQMVEAIAAFGTGNASIAWNGAKVISAYYKSSDDTISITFSSDPLTSFNYSNVGGFYNETLREAKYVRELILTSSTYGSTKKFQITVDDSGTLTATDVT